MVIDVISYNGEADMLELRLNMLGDLVDEFIIVEAPSTFGGLPKALTFDRERFAKWNIKYHVVDENYSHEEIEAARNSKYTGGDIRWMHEYMQKESLKKAMTHLQDEDTCYIGDVDELWEHREPNGIEKLKLRVYTYFLNMTSTEEFWGPVRCKYKDVKDACLNDVRNNISYRTPDYQGWHFTNMGGLQAVKKKVEDNYNHVMFNDELINSDRLDRNFGVRDYIGRDFKLEIDETQWPEYLKNNRQNYKHLLK